MKNEDVYKRQVDGHAELRHRVYVGGEELGGVAHNVAAVYGDKVDLATILLQVGVQEDYYPKMDCHVS